VSAISEDPQRIKVVHTYGPGLHSPDTDPDFDDPRWQELQVLDFVDFAMEAEELGFDGVTVTEHHAGSMTCPSPHLLLAAAAVRTSKIRLGTAVTVLPFTARSVWPRRPGCSTFSAGAGSSSVSVAAFRGRSI